MADPFQLGWNPWSHFHPWKRNSLESRQTADCCRDSATASYHSWTTPQESILWASSATAATIRDSVDSLAMQGCFLSADSPTDPVRVEMKEARYSRGCFLWIGSLTVWENAKHPSSQSPQVSNQSGCCQRHPDATELRRSESLLESRLWNCLCAGRDTANSICSTKPEWAQKNHCCLHQASSALSKPSDSVGGFHRDDCSLAPSIGDSPVDLSDPAQFQSIDSLENSTATAGCSSQFLGG